jgi:hypothetical protein
MPTIDPYTFGSSPFGSVVFGGSLGASPPPTPTPFDLPAALLIALEASTALVAIAPGGFYNGLAPTGIDPSANPYLVFAEVAVKTFRNSGGAGYYEWIDLPFHCFAASIALANQIGDALQAAMEPYCKAPSGLNAVNGYCMSILNRGGSTVPSPRGVGTTRVWKRVITYRAKVGRQA